MSEGHHGARGSNQGNEYTFFHPTMAGLNAMEMLTELVVSERNVLSSSRGFEHE